MSLIVSRPVLPTHLVGISLFMSLLTLSFANSLVSEAGEAGVVETAITVGEQHEFTRMEEDVDRQRLLGTQPAFVGDPATVALTTDLQKKQRWVETEGGRTFKAQCHGDTVQKDYDRINCFRIVTSWS